MSIPVLFVSSHVSLPQEDIKPVQNFVVASSTIDIWIHNLALCESGGRWDALNPRDSDGTPSKGKFQFKDRTFNVLSEKYQIATTTIWNGDEQERIVRRMIEDPDMDLRFQFPACIKKLGLPESVVSE